jgi:hypothetical protein
MGHVMQFICDDAEQAKRIMAVFGFTPDQGLGPYTPPEVWNQSVPRRYGEPYDGGCLGSVTFKFTEAGQAKAYCEKTMDMAKILSARSLNCCLGSIFDASTGIEFRVDEQKQIQYKSNRSTPVKMEIQTQHGNHHVFSILCTPNPSRYDYARRDKGDKIFVDDVFPVLLVDVQTNFDYLRRNFSSTFQPSTDNCYLSDLIRVEANDKSEENPGDIRVTFLPDCDGDAEKFQGVVVLFDGGGNCPFPPTSVISVGAFDESGFVLEAMGSMKEGKVSQLGGLAPITRLQDLYLRDDSLVRERPWGTGIQLVVFRKQAVFIEQISLRRVQNEEYLVLGRAETSLQPLSCMKNAEILIDAFYNALEMKWPPTMGMTPREAVTVRYDRGSRKMMFTCGPKADRVRLSLGRRTADLFGFRDEEYQTRCILMDLATDKPYLRTYPSDVMLSVSQYSKAKSAVSVDCIFRGDKEVNVLVDAVGKGDSKTVTTMMRRGVPEMRPEKEASLGFYPSAAMSSSIVDLNEGISSIFVTADFITSDTFVGTKNTNTIAVLPVDFSNSGLQILAPTQETYCRIENSTIRRIDLGLEDYAGRRLLFPTDSNAVIVTLHLSRLASPAAAAAKKQR